MHIILLNLILACLYFLESSTSLARRVGYLIDSPSSGLFFQNSLGLFSRLLMFIFMPLLAFLSDTQNILIDISYLSFILTPIFLFSVIFFKSSIEKIYLSFVKSISEYGSLFYVHKTLKETKTPQKETNRNVFFINRNLYKGLFFTSSIYYLCWPVVFYCLSNNNEYRATIISLSTLMNGIYTLSNSVFIDPYLAKLAKHKNILLKTYYDLVHIRALSSVFSFLIVLIIFFILND